MTFEKQIKQDFAEIGAMLADKDGKIFRAEYALQLLEIVMPDKVKLAREIAASFSLLDASEIKAMQEAMTAGFERFKKEIER